MILLVVVTYSVLSVGISLYIDPVTGIGYLKYNFGSEQLDREVLINTTTARWFTIALQGDVIE